MLLRDVCADERLLDVLVAGHTLDEELVDRAILVVRDVDQIPFGDAHLLVGAAATIATYAATAVNDAANAADRGANAATGDAMAATIDANAANDDDPHAAIADAAYDNRSEPSSCQWCQ